MAARSGLQRCGCRAVPGGSGAGLFHVVTPSPPSPVAPSRQSVPAGVASLSTHWATHKRGWESVASRNCHEGGGRVTTNVLVRDLDLALPVADGKRLEVVVDGLPQFGGAQSDGRPHGLLLKVEPRSPERGGARIPYPVLVGIARACLEVLGVGSGWPVLHGGNPSCRSYRAKARCENSILRKRVEQAWQLRWVCPVPAEPMGTHQIHT